MDIASTNMTITISKSDGKKVRCTTYSYILHAVLLAIILLFIIANICHHYAKNWSKQKGIDALTMENNEFRIMKIVRIIKVRIKGRTCYYFNGIANLEDIDFDVILIDQKLHENVLIYDISCKSLIVPKSWHINFRYIDEFIRADDGYW